MSITSDKKNEQFQSLYRQQAKTLICGIHDDDDDAESHTHWVLLTNILQNIKGTTLFEIKCFPTSKNTCQKRERYKKTVFSWRYLNHPLAQFPSVSFPGAYLRQPFETSSNKTNFFYTFIKATRLCALATSLSLKGFLSFSKAWKQAQSSALQRT
jgi:hypothetical protein